MPVTHSVSPKLAHAGWDGWLTGSTCSLAPPHSLSPDTMGQLSVCLQDVLPREDLMGRDGS